MFIWCVNSSADRQGSCFLFILPQSLVSDCDLWPDFIQTKLLKSSIKSWQWVRKAFSHVVTPSTMILSSASPRTQTPSEYKQNPLHVCCTPCCCVRIQHIQPFIRGCRESNWPGNICLTSSLHFELMQFGKALIFSSYTNALFIMNTFYPEFS